MGEKDITEKILEDYNDIFADIVNVLLFGGQRRVKPEHLKETSVHSQYKADDGKVHEQERDVAKIWEPNRVELTLYGFENQTAPDKTMPFRIYGYEGASYKSRLQAGKNPIPVITVVLYFGMQHWQTPKTLKEQLFIPDGLEDYVNDCKIHVFEIAWLSEEQVSMFQSDFKEVANFFVQKRKYGENFIPNSTQTIVHVDEVLKLLSAMTGDRHYEEILNSGKEVHNMCEVAERLLQMGRKEGLEEGRAEGLEKGRAESREEDISRMLRSGKTPQQIADFCGYDIAVVKKIEAEMLASV